MVSENSCIEEEAVKENVYKLVVEVFESSLLEADLTDSIDNLTQLYASFSSQGFESSFEDILMLTVSDSKRSNDIQKIFRLISDFAVSLDNKYKAEHSRQSNDGGDDDDEVCLHPFLEYLFETLRIWSEAASCTIRFRSCQLLYMILTHVLESGGGEIDLKVYENIAKLIETRRKDVSATVRAHSLLLAKFFQDPSDHDDPVIAALCWQLQADPNCRVRQNILEILAACEETIIPVTKRFLFDTNSLVRNSALLHICHRIGPRSYSAEYRNLILNQCFKDASAIVRRNAEQKLIPVWFRAYGDKLCAFYKSLRIGSGTLDKLRFIKPLTHQLFKLVKISQILEEIDFDPETALPRYLDGDKIFVWHCFYLMAYKQEKLKKFIPQPEVLVEFIARYFKEPRFEEAYAYNELISFAMDIMDVLGDEKCETIPHLAIDLMMNVLTPKDVIPYAVIMYCEYSTKETKEIQTDILQTIDNLMKCVDMSSGEAQKNLIIKCLVIFCETLAQDNVSASIEVMTVKDELVLPSLDFDDDDIKREAYRALSLYCLLDIVDARQFWPFIEKAIYDNSENLNLDIMKGAFDLFKCYGCKILGDENDETLKKFEDVLDDLLLHAVESEIDMKIVFEGMTKLYLSHHIYSPVVLAKLIIFMFDPEDGQVLKNSMVDFLELYGESSEEAECLTKAFLAVINLLFSADKSNPYHKISIKTVVLQLLEFAKLFEENKNFDVQKKFRDLLVLKLTHKFIKKPRRLPTLDLQEICGRIVPQDTDILMKLKENIKTIIECLGSAVFHQKTSLYKKSTQFFTSYLKKIQTVLNAAAEEEINDTQRLNLAAEEEINDTQRLNSAAEEEINDTQRLNLAAEEEINDTQRLNSAAEERINDTQRLNSAAEEEINDTQRLNSAADSSFEIATVEIEQDSPLSVSEEKSF